MHICSGVVFIFGSLTRIGSLHRVAVIGPGSEREVAERSDPKVIARKRHRAIIELLVVGVAGHVGQTNGSCPRSSIVSGFGAKDIQRWRNNAGGAVADRARRREARIKPAVPPKHVQHSTIGGNIREELVTNGLIINQRGSGVCSSRAVVPCKEYAGLAALAGHCGRKERCSSLHYGSRLGWIIDDVNPLVRFVQLI